MKACGCCPFCATVLVWSFIYPNRVFRRCENIDLSAHPESAERERERCFRTIPGFHLVPLEETLLPLSWMEDSLDERLENVSGLSVVHLGWLSYCQFSYLHWEVVSKFNSAQLPRWPWCFSHSLFHGVVTWPGCGHNGGAKLVVLFAFTWS